MRRPLTLVAGVAWFSIVLGLYLSTLQTDVNGSGDPFMIDVGEIQGALATWGTLHPSGYPLYTILGNLIVRLVRVAGGTPATGVSILSLCASIGALILIYFWMVQIGSHPVLTSVIVALLATAPTLWLQSVIAEVYALNFVLVAGCLLLAFHIGQRDDSTRLPWLGLLWGIAVSHHRTALLLAPALLYLVWQRPCKSGMHYKVLGYTIVAFFVPFLAYIYLPLRSHQHAVWVYGHPDTWSDFWYIFLSKEYRPFIQSPSSWTILVGRFEADMQFIGTELPFGILGLLGLASGLFRRQTRQVSVSMTLVLVSFFGFSLFYTVPDKAVMLLPTLIPVVVGLSLLAQSFEHRWRRVLELGLTCLLFIELVCGIFAHVTSVSRLSRDTGGRELVAAAQRLSDTRPAIISLWGRDWFAYRYAKYASGELATVDILPPHTDPRPIWQAGQRVYVAKHTFYQMPLSQWRERWGPVYLRSATYGLIEVAPHPEITSPSDLQDQPINMGEHIQLLGYRLDYPSRSVCYLTLYWQCLSVPEANYHVFVHLTGHLPPRGPEDVLAQADTVHSVYGWYPTSMWTPGEVIRDDFRLSVANPEATVAILTGLYTQDPVSGEFFNLGVLTIPLSETSQ